MSKESDNDFEKFWKGLNPRAMSARNLAKVAWNISQQQTKRKINAMKNASQLFDGSNCENLHEVLLNDPKALRELAATARDHAAVCVDSWAEDYAQLSTTLESLASRIDRTMVPAQLDSLGGGE